MAKLQRNSMIGEFAELSTYFLKENGFVNIETCSDKSVWVRNGIQIHIDRDAVVTDFPKLFELIYQSGYNYGEYMERKKLLNATKQFIENYGKENKSIYY